MLGSDWVIEEPQTLAEIPQDLTGSVGKIWASDVCAIAGPQRKKRCETALAIDRQGVNVYDIRKSRLVSSYAVSPWATFTCPPCSLRFRSSARSPARRFTFCSLLTPEARLICFSETLSADLGADSRITTSTFELENSDSPVIHLEAVEIGDNGQSDTSGVQLLAIRRNGYATWHDGSLEKELCSLRTSLSDDGRVLLVMVTNAVQLRNGILKHRADVSALFGPIEDEIQSNVLILLIRNDSAKRGREDAALTLQVFKLGAPDTGLDRSMGGPKRNLQALASLNIPEQVHPKKSVSTFSLHVASGTLYQQTPDLCTLYDLTGLLPRIAHNLTLPKKDITSCIRLSPCTLALSGHSSFSLIRLPYCSLQAEQEVKSSPPAEQKPLRLLSYMAAVNAIVAIKGRRLVTIRQTDPNIRSGAFGKRKREGTLMDAIGRGTCSVARVQANNREIGRSMRKLGTLLTIPGDQPWKTIMMELDARFLQEGVETFCDLKEFPEANQPLRDMIGGDEIKKIYLSSKLFTVKRYDVPSNNALGLEVNDLDHQQLEAIFNWLLQRRSLTSDRIENSLKRSGLLHPSESLEPGSIINALTYKHLSSTLLSSLLASETSLDLQELATALAAMTMHWDSTGSLNDQKLLTDAESHADKMQVDTNGIQRQSLGNASSPANTASDSTHRLLYLILSRFYLLPQSSIQPALRSHFSKTHLLQLIDILRVEIARSGWLSPYDDDLTPSTAFSTPNDHLAHITHLLNSAIDAIGAGGWMLGSGSGLSSGSGSGSKDWMTETADTISYMKAEISAALEGIEEAVYLKGMLGEVLLCGKDALLPPSKIPKGGAAAAAALPSRNKNVPPQTMALPTVESSSSDALPLGLKLDQKVSLTKVGAGGELIGRSKRDIGRLKSKMVGKYSFERIVL